MPIVIKISLLFLDGPLITIQGETKVPFGGTAQFEADVKNVTSLSWSITWHRRNEDVIQCINPNIQRYIASTERKLVIKPVCKQDEGIYQAVLSLESNGPYYKSRNNIRLHVIEGKLLDDTNITLSYKEKPRHIYLSSNTLTHVHVGSLVIHRME